MAGPTMRKQSLGKPLKRPATLKIEFIKIVRYDVHAILSMSGDWLLLFDLNLELAGTRRVPENFVIALGLVGIRL